MNLLDVLLLMMVVAAAMGGYREGMLTRGFGLIGLILGLLTSVWVASLVLGWVMESEPGVRMLALIAAVVITATVGATAGQLIGLRARARAHLAGLGHVDRAAGGVLGLLTVLVGVWLFVPALADVSGPLAAQIRQSRGVAFVEAVMPEPPDTVRALRQLVAQSRFPEVFADLRPAPEVGPPPEEIPVSESVVQAATRSTVNVESLGCGGRFEGSGFVVADGVVVTNAHVVAGTEAVQVRLPEGTGEVLDAQVVAFDGDTDLALLEVPGLSRPPLAVRDAGSGEDGAVIGYPGGQDVPRIAPAGVRDRQTAIGRDIYGRTPTSRRILVLAANLRQGDSGAALIGTDGAAIGVVFAVSPDDPNTAFALDTQELRDFLAAGRTGGAGPCI